MKIDNSEKDHAAAKVVDLWCSFQVALTDNKRKYPVQEFFLFASAARHYIKLTRRERLVHREVVVAIKNLTQTLELERKRVPGEILYEADRLECFFFAAYDPHFEGDEPPGP